MYWCYVGVLGVLPILVLVTVVVHNSVYTSLTSKGCEKRPPFHLIYYYKLLRNRDRWRFSTNIRLADGMVNTVDLFTYGYKGLSVCDLTKFVVISMTEIDSCRFTGGHYLIHLSNTLQVCYLMTYLCCVGVFCYIYLEFSPHDSLPSVCVFSSLWRT